MRYFLAANTLTQQGGTTNAYRIIALDRHLSQKRIQTCAAHSRAVVPLERERLESSDAYDREEKCEPNAICMQSVFVYRPAYTFKIVMDQLKTAYYPHLRPKARSAYD